MVRVLAGDELRWAEPPGDVISLHGFRVDGPEVERVIATHPELADVAVVVQRPEGVEPRLAAFVVARRSVRPTMRDLVRFLADRVPPFMVPATFTFVDTIPRDASGQVEPAGVQ
jgi:acyl-coenzyme A synthetase/AMP-(fatty) acid ligase